MGIPKLECVVGELAVLAQRANHGMNAQERHGLLLGPLTLDERSEGAKVKSRVTKGGLAGLLNGPGRMAAREAQKANEDSRTLDAPSLDHRLGPRGALGAQSKGYPVQ